jgi:hypothetical protein
MSLCCTNMSLCFTNMSPCNGNKALFFCVYIGFNPYSST